MPTASSSVVRRVSVGALNWGVPFLNHNSGLQRGCPLWTWYVWQVGTVCLETDSSSYCRSWRLGVSFHALCAPTRVEEMYSLNKLFLLSTLQFIYGLLMLSVTVETHFCFAHHKPSNSELASWRPGGSVTCLQPAKWASTQAGDRMLLVQMGQVLWCQEKCIAVQLPAKLMRNISARKLFSMVAQYLHSGAVFKVHTNRLKVGWI